MTLEWGGRTQRKLAGCVGISGYCYDPEALGAEASEAAKACPWLVTHGVQDEVLPFAVTKAQVEALITAAPD